MMAASAQDDDLICLNISWFEFQIDHLAKKRNKFKLSKSYKSSTNNIPSYAKYHNEIIQSYKNYGVCG